MNTIAHRDLFDYTSRITVLRRARLSGEGQTKWSWLNHISIASFMIQVATMVLAASSQKQHISPKLFPDPWRMYLNNKSFGPSSKALNIGTCPGVNLSLLTPPPLQTKPATNELEKQSHNGYLFRLHAKNCVKDR